MSNTHQLPRKGVVGISISSAQYHFVTEDGWREGWVTITPGEWWAKHLWEEAGGYEQDTQTTRNS